MALKNISKKVIDDIVKNRYTTGLDAEEQHGYFTTIFRTPPDELRQSIDDLITLASHKRADSRSHVLALHIIACFVDILPTVRDYVLKERIPIFFDTMYTFHSSRHRKRRKRKQASIARFPSDNDASALVLHLFLRILSRWKRLYESDNLEFSVFLKYISDKKHIIFPEPLDDSEISILYPLRQLYEAVTNTSIGELSSVEDHGVSQISEFTTEKMESLDRTVDFLEYFSDDAMVLLDVSVASAYQKGRQLLANLLSYRDANDPSQTFPMPFVTVTNTSTRRDFSPNGTPGIDRKTLLDTDNRYDTPIGNIAGMPVASSSLDKFVPAEYDTIGKNDAADGLIWSHISDDDDDDADDDMDIPVQGSEFHINAVDDDDDIEWEYMTTPAQSPLPLTVTDETAAISSDRAKHPPRHQDETNTEAGTRISIATPSMKPFDTFLDASDPMRPKTNSTTDTTDLASLMFPPIAKAGYDDSSMTNTASFSLVNIEDGATSIPADFPSSQDVFGKFNTPSFLTREFARHPVDTATRSPGRGPLGDKPVNTNASTSTAMISSDTRDTSSSGDMTSNALRGAIAGFDAVDDIIDLSVHSDGADSPVSAANVKIEDTIEDEEVLSPAQHTAAVQSSLAGSLHSTRCDTCDACECRCAGTNTQLRSSSGTLQVLSSVTRSEVEEDDKEDMQEEENTKDIHSSGDTETIRSDLLALLIQVERSLLPAVQKRILSIAWAKNMNWILGDITKEDISKAVQHRKDTLMRLHGHIRDSLMNTLPIRNSNMEALVEITAKRYSDKLTEYSKQLHSLVRDCTRMGVELTTASNLREEEDEFLYGIHGIRPKRVVEKKRRSPKEAMDAEPEGSDLLRPSSSPGADDYDDSLEDGKAHLNRGDQAILTELKRLREEADGDANDQSKRAKSDSMRGRHRNAWNSWHYISGPRPHIGSASASLRQHSIQTTGDWRPGEHLTRAMNVAITQSIQKKQTTTPHNPTR